MKTQQDTKIRMVALENLKAMCKRISGVCHRFEIVKVSKSRVHVAYSNPDEYGKERPMTAVLPCFPSSSKDDEENPRVLCEVLRVINDSADGEGWQYFYWIFDSPTLYRNSETNEWKTHREINDGKTHHSQSVTKSNHPHSCVVCDLPTEEIKNESSF